jgi:hypothetical protein
MAVFILLIVSFLSGTLIDDGKFKGSKSRDNYRSILNIILRD